MKTSRHWVEQVIRFAYHNLVKPMNLCQISHRNWMSAREKQWGPANGIDMGMREPSKLQLFLLPHLSSGTFRLLPHGVLWMLTIRCHRYSRQRLKIVLLRVITPSPDPVFSLIVKFTPRVNLRKQRLEFSTGCRECYISTG